MGFSRWTCSATLLAALGAPTAPFATLRRVTFAEQTRVISRECPRTWLVNSASDRLGCRNFPVPDVSTKSWWVALLAYGEGWHNNYHAFPTSARHGMRFWEIDPAYAFIRLLQAIGLAWNLQTPPAQRLQFKQW